MPGKPARVPRHRGKHLLRDVLRQVPVAPQAPECRPKDQRQEPAHELGKSVLRTRLGIAAELRRVVHGVPNNQYPPPKISAKQFSHRRTRAYLPVSGSHSRRGAESAPYLYRFSLWVGRRAWRAVGLAKAGPFAAARYRV
jgi:hypothetical protein